MWCGVPREYYLTLENASRQNCRVSDSGYHDFVVFPMLQKCCLSLCWGKSKKKQLIEHRRIKRPNTI